MCAKACSGRDRTVKGLDIIARLTGGVPGDPLVVTLAPEKHQNTNFSRFTPWEPSTSYSSGQCQWSVHVCATGRYDVGTLDMDVWPEKTVRYQTCPTEFRLNIGYVQSNSNWT